MRTLIILLLLAAAVAVAVVLVRRWQQRQAEERARAEAPKPRRDPLAEVHGNEDLLYGLKVSDVLTYHARDYLVRGSLRFDEGGFTWTEHLISDERDQHWLAVEDDEGISVSLYQRVPASDVDGEPGAPTVRHGEVSYRLQEQSEATYTAEGTTGTAPSGTVRYVDYQGDDGHRLSFEQFGDRWEVSVGSTVLPRTITVYPTSE